MSDLVRRVGHRRAVEHGGGHGACGGGAVVAVRWVVVALFIVLTVGAALEGEFVVTILAANSAFLNVYIAHLESDR